MTDYIVSQIINPDLRPTAGLAATVDSVGYILAELDNHVHSPMQCYGAASNNMSRGAVDPFQLTGGADAYGTELQIHDGTVIESGSTTKYFDFNTLFVVAVGTANRATFIEFYYGSQNTGVVCTSDKTSDKITKATHGLSNGTKVMFSPTANLPAGINSYTVYYVVNKADNDFEVSLTSGGAKVDITGDAGGEIKYHTLNQTLLSEIYISMAATNADSVPYMFQSPRVTCNNRLWMRGKSKTGTCTVDMFFGLHTYSG